MSVRAEQRHLALRVFECVAFGEGSHVSPYYSPPDARMVSPVSPNLGYNRDGKLMP